MFFTYKKIAGAAYLNYVRSLATNASLPSILSGEVRDACTPLYSIGPCIGDCRRAFQSYTKVNLECSNGPLSFESQCQNIMPCKCYYSDLIRKYPGIAVGGAATCGNCATVTSGDVCNFFCLNGNPMTVLDQFGVPRAGGLFSAIPCSDQGWPDFGAENASFTLPVCPNIPDQCPPVLGINAQGTSLGFAPNVKSPNVCIGATETDVCEVSCAPAFYSPLNRFSATCKKFFRDGVQVLDWFPWNQNSIYGHQDICICQGCRSGDIDYNKNNACPCQVNENYSISSICPA